MLAHDEIQSNYVYVNEDGERRLVFGISSGNTVLWRTANPELPKAVKAQGSSTLKSFARWPVKKQVATEADWGAYKIVARRREWATRDHQSLKRIRATMARERRALQ